ncbi:hypothetical protein ACFL5K_00925 [Gemmatimonadota bacterium]
MRSSENWARDKLEFVGHSCTEDKRKKIDLLLSVGAEFGHAPAENLKRGFVFRVNMAGRKKKKLRLDLADLQEMIARDKREIEQARAELNKIGGELKKEHMQRMLHPEGVTLTGQVEAPSLNHMCRKCLNSCKQAESAKIFSCAKYDPVD